MGFAGQVFAARVAVGLAVPSPSAFSSAGAQIGKFSANMYSKLNKQAIQSASKNQDNTQKNLSIAQNRMKKHLKSQNNMISKGSRQAIKNLASEYKGLGEASKMTAGHMKGLSRAVPKPVQTKLFKGVSADMKAAGDYQRMMKNFTKLSLQERKAVMLGIRAQKAALQGLIVTDEQKKKLGKKGLKYIQNEIRGVKHQEDQFKLAHDTMIQEKEKFGNKTKKIQRSIDKAQGKADKAQRNYNDLLKKSTERVKQWSRATGEAVGQLKQGFNEALRESVGALTAFYYKLNQNVQELIAFERELYNANSVFNITNDQMFEVGNTVVEFGQKFGMEMQNGATGLYQLASAGLTANEAMQVLPETLKLSMAVQGDHNTISKLTAQTLFGFGMEMSQAAEVTDKFAHAIQKSLIEYEDLSSAVKFALPFFTTTGQSIDQLLGALAVLTNRALEAGIAGRGLRQGLAELAESVGDNTAAFRKLGVEVTNEQGDMLQLTEIAANFAKTLEEGVINDTQLLTMLIEDLNVRGATAFVHLVQASDEFTEAVKDSETAGGQLDAMVKKQNESMGAQIQILRNNVQAIFMLRDANYQGTNYMNAFHEAIVKGVESLQDLLVATENGRTVLTALGQQIQDIAVQGISMMVEMLQQLIPLIKDFTESGGMNVELLKVYLIPLQLVVAAIDFFGPGLVKVVIAYSLLNKTMGLNIALMWSWAGVQKLHTKLIGEATVFEAAHAAVKAYGNKVMADGRWANRNNIRQMMKKIIVKKYEIWLDGKSFKAKVRDTAATVANTIAKSAATIVTWALGAAMWFLTGAFLANPIALFAIAVAAIAIGMVVVIRRFYDFGDVLHTIKAGFSAWIGMVKWLTGGLAGIFISAGSAIMDMLEGPAFVMLKFFQHFFKMVMYYVNSIKDKLEGLSIGGVLGKLKFWGEGGMANPIYAAQGATVGAPSAYVVGERGPELFLPRQAGRIVANKDLNTQRVNNMLQDSFDMAPRQGAAGITQANTLVVSSLNVGSADLRKTKLGVDVFG